MATTLLARRRVALIAVVAAAVVAMALPGAAAAATGATVTVTDAPERTLTFTDSDDAHTVSADSFLGILRIRLVGVDPLTGIDASGARGFCLNFGFSVECSGFAGRVVIDMRGGADTFTVSEAAVDPFLRDIVVLGGSGNDVLTTGRGDDVMDGGPGDDVLSGGTGTDVADYAERSTPVTATVPDPGAVSSGNGSAAGENDSFQDVEGATGGAADDRLTGGAGGDVLDGGPGSDTLDGGTGDDDVTGGPGADTISAGAGDDFVDSSDVPKLADLLVGCGAGRDAVFADNGVDPVGADCEIVAPEIDDDPAVVGSAVEGQTLTAVVPGFSGGPASSTIEWLACAPAGDECEGVGVRGPAYVLTEDDVGLTLRVLHRAQNEAGLDERISPPSPVVAAAPRAPAAPAPSPPPPAPATPAAAPAPVPAPARVPTAAPVRLGLAFTAVRCAGRRCTVRLRLRGDVARLRAELRRGGRTVARAARAARRGRLTLSLRPRERLRRGAYVVRVTLIGADGRTRRFHRTVRVGAR